jgi:hypothetical protein
MNNKYFDELEEIGSYLLGVRNASEETGNDFSASACKVAIKRLQHILESIEGNCHTK